MWEGMRVMLSGRHYPSHDPTTHRLFHSRIRIIGRSRSSFNSLMQCSPLSGPSGSLHSADLRLTLPSLETGWWTSSTGWTKNRSPSCLPLDRAFLARRQHNS
jgi:hypothetical protein